MAEVDAALTALARDEAAAWAGWAKDPSSAAEPSTSSEARQDLMRRKALAEADVASAERAAHAVEAARLQLTDELRQVGLGLFAFEVEDITDEYLANALAPPFPAAPAPPPSDPPPATPDGEVCNLRSLPSV